MPNSSNRTILKEHHVNEIRQQFYELNALLFKNYQSYLDVNPDTGDVEFKIEEFMKEQEKNNKHLIPFYERLFHNENYQPPTKGDDEQFAQK